MISNQTVHVSNTLTAGVTAFSFSPMTIWADSELRVVVTDSAGVRRALTLNTDYTVNRNNSTVNFVTAPYATYGAGSIEIASAVPYSQEDDYSYLAFSPDRVEKSLDRVTVQLLQLAYAVESAPGSLGYLAEAAASSADTATTKASEAAASATAAQQAAATVDLPARIGSTAGGTANALAVALNPPLTQLIPGMPIYIKAAFANTGACTLNVDGLGAQAIRKAGGAALDAGDILAGQIIEVAWDGTNFQLLSAYSLLDYATSTGSANAYVLTLAPALPALVAGRMLTFKANFANTGAATLNVNALGAKSILHGQVTLDAGDIQSGQLVTVMYDGTSFQMMQCKRGVLVPSGTVAYIAASSAPGGWLKCNGAAVSRTTYAALFAAIGTVFGAGDGSTTFNLPDLRGEFVRGWDDGRGIDSGRAFGSLQNDAMQGHKHQGYGNDNANSGWYGNRLGDQATNTATSVAFIGTPTTDGTNGTPRTAAETRPRNIALLACIKY